MKKKEKDAQFASSIPGILSYHQLMLSDGVRNKMLYEAIKSHINNETNFLDIGAGTGVWAILAAKLGAKRVVAVEIEECLIPIIYKHAQENGVADKIEIIHGNSDDVKIRGKFNLIVSELFGGGAFNETTTNSFISLRKRFLAPGGVLIPQKLIMFAVPAQIDNPTQDSPAEIPISCNFIKSLKLNYHQNFSIDNRKKVKFLAEPRKLFEVDFQNVDSYIPLNNLSVRWELENLSNVNAFVTFTSSIFTDQIEMNAFDSQSWGTTVYEIQPLAQEEGEISFNVTMDEKKEIWSVISKSNGEIKTQNFSPSFSPMRLRMTQKMTPYRKIRTKKPDAAAK